MSLTTKHAVTNGRVAGAPTLLPLAVMIGLAFASPAGAVSTPNVVGGQASIQTNGATTTVDQTTARAVINWNNFDIGASQSVQFNLPSASGATLNRVTAGGATQINGSLTSNGALYVINPNGIAVGKTGQINANGVVLSSLDTSDNDFMSQNVAVTFNQVGGSAGTVSNNGHITAPNRSVTLIGGKVVNDVSGVIDADTINLVAAQTATFGFGGSIATGTGPGNLVLMSHGTIGSQPIDPVEAAKNYVISNTGAVEASDVKISADTGSVWLAGSVSGSNVNIDSAGVLNGQGGVLNVANGGQATISAASNLSLGQVDAGSGNLQVNGQRVTLNGNVNAGNVNVTSYDAVKADGAINAQGNVNLSTRSQMALASVSAGGNVSLQGAGGISATGAISGQNVTIQADTSVVLQDNLTAQDQAWVYAGNSLTVGKLGAGKSVSAKNVSLILGNDLNVWGGVYATDQATLLGQNGTVFVNGGIHAPSYQVTTKGATYTVVPPSYTPVYGANGYDQYGYDQYGFSQQGYNAGGLDRYGRPNPNVQGVTSDSRMGTGTVALGAGSITKSGTTTTIDQYTSSMIVNWDKFGISPGASVLINQPSSHSAILNRVTGTDISYIDGLLRANGQVFLVNPYGIVVGSSGVINANGVVLSTLDIGDNTFAKWGSSGAQAIVHTGGSGNVVNNGTIHVSDSGALLLGTQVLNGPTGSIDSQGGDIQLLSGDLVGFDPVFRNAKILNASSDPTSKVSNEGALFTSEGGRILLSAGQTQDTSFDTIINTGTIQASGRAPSNIPNASSVSILGVGYGNLNLDGLIQGANIAVSGKGDINVSGQVNSANSINIASKGKSLNLRKGSQLTANGLAVLSGQNVSVDGAVNADNITVTAGGWTDSAGAVKVGTDGQLNGNCCINVLADDIYVDGAIKGASVLLRSSPDGSVTVGAHGNVNGDTVTVNGHHTTIDGTIDGNWVDLSDFEDDGSILDIGATGYVHATNDVYARAGGGIEVKGKIDGGKNVTLLASNFTDLDGGTIRIGNEGQVTAGDELNIFGHDIYVDGQLDASMMNLYGTSSKDHPSSLRIGATGKANAEIFAMYGDKLIVDGTVSASKSAAFSGETVNYHDGFILSPIIMVNGQVIDQ